MAHNVLHFLPDNNQSYNTTSCPVNGLGLFEELYLQTREVRLEKEDLVILLTDGAYSRINDNELKYIIDMKNDDSEKVSSVFNLVNKKGNMDNQTIVMLRF